MFVLKVHTAAVSPLRTHVASSERLALCLFSIWLPAVLGGEGSNNKKIGVGGGGGGGDRPLAHAVPLPPCIFVAETTTTAQLVPLLTPDLEHRITI